MQWYLRILEITHPVRNTKVHQVEDRLDAQPPHLAKPSTRETPVVLPRPQMNQMVRQAIPQHPRPQLLHQLQIPPPVPVMATLLEQVPAKRSAARINDARIRAFNPRG